MPRATSVTPSAFTITPSSTHCEYESLQKERNQLKPSRSDSEKPLLYSPQCPDDLFGESSDASRDSQHEGDEAKARVDRYHGRAAAVGSVLAAHQNEETGKEVRRRLVSGFKRPFGIFFNSSVLFSPGL